MLAYLVRRLMLAVLTVWAVSVLSFVVIQLPPGDYITSYIAQMSSSGSFVSEQEANALRQQYGLDQPQYIQYIRWMKMVLHGNYGMALEYGRGIAVFDDGIMRSNVTAFGGNWRLAFDTDSGTLFGYNTANGCDLRRCSLDTNGVAVAEQYTDLVADWARNSDVRAAIAGKARGKWRAPTCTVRSASVSGFQRMWMMGSKLLRTGILQRWAYVSCLSVCKPGDEEPTFERMKQMIAAAAPEFQLYPPLPAAKPAGEN